MKQVIQNVGSGELQVQEIPAPAVAPQSVLIANQSSLVSAGTEKMIVDLSKKSLLGKARERPDQVKRVLEKIRNEGLFSTIDQVRKKLETPMTMGYSSAGIVIACGAGVQNFKPGDRVASNGPHAEVVCVPKNLCASVADDVPFDHACFAVLGSIAMQGIRLSKTVLGDTVFVIGLGLVGQMTVALLKSAGARVIGTDLDQSKCDLALKMGAAIARPGIKASEIEQMTGGAGSDSVIITASTKSNQPIELSADAVRKKGRVVLVGVVGLELDRRPFYFKEAEFVVSCSYGPGRYDPNYEDRGIDYPVQYVRWTQQRNIQSVLDLMASGAVDVSPLISHKFSVDDADKAYDIINTGSEPYLGIVLNYPEVGEEKPASTIQINSPAKSSSGKARFGLLGAGNFARMVLLPAIQKSDRFQPVSICTAKGVSGTQLGNDARFETSTTDENVIFDDDSLSTVFSITRHNQHAGHVLKAIEAGKNVFVEKPLCLTTDELTEIESALAKHETPPRVMVGFNRRFAPTSKELRSIFANTAPISVAIRFNAGAIPSDHWTQNDEEGGGRIIGEACHAIDLATYLTGSIPVRVYAESVATNGSEEVTDDQCFITLRHENGSISNIGYIASGSKSFPKERIEVFGGGKVGVIDDFKSLSINTGGKTSVKKQAQNKGHQQEIVEWGEAIADGKESPISWPEIRSVTLASIMAIRSLREGQPFDI